MIKVLATLLLASSIALAACGNEKSPAANASPGDSKDASTGPPMAKRLTWGQPGEIVGTNGGKLRITPLGLLYHRGPYKGVNGPENAWFVAIALRGEAVDRPDSTAAPMTGGGFMWQGGGEKLTSVDGNATSTPWIGSVNEFSNVPIQPAEPEVGIETFDVSSKTGGRLLYVNPETYSVTSWELPTNDQGTGLDKVRNRIKLFS